TLFCIGKNAIAPKNAIIPTIKNTYLFADFITTSYKSFFAAHAHCLVQFHYILRKSKNQQFFNTL
ncbi:MAG: hypothetical protein RR956_07175, partial [Christensenella sp.]